VHGVFDGLAVRLDLSDADADGEGDEAPGVFDLERFDAAAEAFGEDDGSGAVGFGQQYGELFAAHAAENVGGAQVSLEVMAEGDEGGIAAGVAVGIVDSLEAIGVDHEQAERAAVAAAADELIVGADEETAPVGDSGEGIGGGETENFAAELEDFTDHGPENELGFEGERGKHDGENRDLESAEPVEFGIAFLLADCDDAIERVEERRTGFGEEADGNGRQGGVVRRKRRGLFGVVDEGAHFGVDGMKAAEIEILDQMGVVWAGVVCEVAAGEPQVLRFELRDSGFEVFFGLGIAQFILSDEAGDALGEHALAAADIDDLGHAFDVAPGGALDEMGSEREAGNEQQGAGIVTGEPAREYFVGRDQCGSDPLGELGRAGFCFGSGGTVFACPHPD